MNICEKCWYYSKTWFGNICNYDGTFNPMKKRCPNFKPRALVEKRSKEIIELTKLIFSLSDRLVEITQKIKRLKDKELRKQLLEVCIAAKQIKKMFEK